MVESQDGLDLVGFLKILLYYKWTVVIFFVIGLAGGLYMGSKSEPQPEYTASTLIKVGKKGQGFYPTGVLEEKTFAEEIEIARSRAFLERVAQRLKPDIEMLAIETPKLHQLTRLTSWLLGQGEGARATSTRGTPLTLHDTQVGMGARSGVYTVLFHDAHTFAISPADQEAPRTGELGQRFTGWGFSFTLMGGPVAAQTRLVVQVRTLEEVITALSGSLTFVPLKETNLLRVSTTSHNPERAKECVRLAVEEFMAFGRLHSEQEAAQSLSYMTRQLEVVQNSIEEHLNAIRRFKEQHPLASLAEDPHALLDQRSSYEAQLRKEIRKIQENVDTTQALLDAVNDPSEDSTTGNAMLNQAILLGDVSVIDEVNNLLGLEEEQRTQGRRYIIVDPTTMEIETKAKRARKRLAEHVAGLLYKYQKQYFGHFLLRR
jgi:uncharacterized protein involved in exopolysaccharide biosynthesis